MTDNEWASKGKKLLTQMEAAEADLANSLSKG